MVTREAPPYASQAKNGPLLESKPNMNKKTKKNRTNVMVKDEKSFFLYLLIVLCIHPNTPIYIRVIEGVIKTQIKTLYKT